MTATVVAAFVITSHSVSARRERTKNRANNAPPTIASRLKPIRPARLMGSGRRRQFAGPRWRCATLPSKARASIRHRARLASLGSCASGSCLKMDWKIVLLEHPALTAILAAIEATVRGDDKSRCLGIRRNSAYCRCGLGQSATDRAPRRAGFIADIDPTGTCRPHSFRAREHRPRRLSTGWPSLAQPARSPMLAAILAGHYLAADDRNDDLRPRIGRSQARSSRSFPSALATSTKVRPLSPLVNSRSRPSK